MGRRLSPAWLMVLASFLFATMGVCVKLASAEYAPGEIIFYRGLIGAVLIFTLARSRGVSLATKVPATHFWRSLTGVIAMFLWFYALGNLPLATAMTLNYMSSVWMALFLLGGAAMLGSAKVDGRLIGTVLLGFAGVALILRPTIEQDQLWHGLIGLLSGMISATAYLQVTALARAGEPEMRIVFYFSVGGAIFGLGADRFAETCDRARRQRIGRRGNQQAIGNLIDQRADLAPVQRQRDGRARGTAGAFGFGKHFERVTLGEDDALALHLRGGRGQRADRDDQPR